MDPSTIAKYESGERHIPYTYLEAFAKYAGWPITDLIARAKKELDDEPSLLAQGGVMIKAFSDFITRVDDERPEALVVACLLARGSCSASEISIPTGLSLRSTRKIAKALELRGIVRRDGRRWRIVQCFSRSPEAVRAAVKALTPCSAEEREKYLDVLFDSAGDYGANMAALLFEIADREPISSS